MKHIFLRVLPYLLYELQIIGHGKVPWKFSWKGNRERRNYEAKKGRESENPLPRETEREREVVHVLNRRHVRGCVSRAPEMEGT